MTDHDAAPLAEIRRPGIEELRSMVHYGECRAPAANCARAGCLQSWLSGGAAHQSLSHFPPTGNGAIAVEKPGGIFSGLVLDSMSNMLSRNNETGHQPFHLTPFTDCQSCQLVSYLDDVYFNSHLWIFLWYAVGKRQVWPSPVPCGLRRSFM